MNFAYQNPTRLVFGAGSLVRLGELAGTIGKRALLVTGGGSVKRNGTFDRALESLTEAGVSMYECEGVEPNPRISSVKRGLRTARDNDCDLITHITESYFNGSGDTPIQDRFEAFLKSMGCPTRFHELGIDGQLVETYAKETLRIIHDEDGRLPARPPMTEADIVSALRAAL